MDTVAKRYIEEAKIKKVAVKIEINIFFLYLAWNTSIKSKS